MIVVGLTGSIGMGKSTTAKLFAEAGAPVWSADTAVHALYAAGGPAVAPIRAAFPGAVIDGVVDRGRLSSLLQAAPEGFARLEGIVHPLVAHARTEFLERARESGRAVVVLDIPLLFETGGESLVDAVVVASAPQAVQRERVLARDGMHPEKFAAILARQVPDVEKRARAHFVVDTSAGIENARDQVGRILARLTDPAYQPRPRVLDPANEPQQD